ncbi:MAG: STAS domain-containing protein [Deltaproteobacteria bacterium]|nr:STAS domain-containing protein [Deltaproteobacteria bacterium]
MIEISKNGDQLVVKPGADVVASMANEFRSQLHELIQESPKILVIDLNGVKMVDSVGIGVIIATHNSLNKIDGELRVTNVADDIFTLFSTMRLDHHFTIEKRE